MPKPAPILLQMPWNVKKLIIDSTDTQTKISIRSVSKEFKDLVSLSRISYKKVILKILVELRKAAVTFVPYPGCEMNVQYKPDVWNFSVLVRESDKKIKVWIDAAVDQFVKVFKNPKVLLERLEVRVGCVSHRVDFPDVKIITNLVCDSLQSFFSSLTHPIFIDEFWFESATPNGILKILPYIQLGTLKSIGLIKPPELGLDGQVFELNEVAETAQWKLATGEFFSKGFPMTLPFQKVSHFSELVFDVHELTLNQLKTIFDSFVRSSKLKECTLTGESLEFNSIINYFEQLGIQKQKDFRRTKFVISTPNSRIIAKVYPLSVFFVKQSSLITVCA